MGCRLHRAARIALRMETRHRSAPMFSLSTSKEKLYEDNEDDQFPRGLRSRRGAVPAHCSQGRASPATQVRGGEVLWGRQSRQERLSDGELVMRRDLKER